MSAIAELNYRHLIELKSLVKDLQAKIEHQTETIEILQRRVSRLENGD